MALASNSDVAQVQEALVGEIVQRELQAAAKLRPLFGDYSGLVGKGTSEVKLPTASSFSVTDRDNDTPSEATAQNLVFGGDVIQLNIQKEVYYVIPGDVELDAKPSYELEAAKRAASAHGRDFDKQLLDALWDGADVANNIEYDAGVSDIEEVILQMIQKADEQEMLDDGGRILFVKPSERKRLLEVANFVQADKYGTGEAPISSGELGMLYGVRVLMTNVSATAGKFEGGKMMLAHRESLGFAFKRQPTHDMDKIIKYGAGSMEHIWSIYYGVKALQGGKLIVRADNFTP